MRGSLCAISAQCRYPGTIKYTPKRAISYLAAVVATKTCAADCCNKLQNPRSGRFGHTSIRVSCRPTAAVCEPRSGNESQRCHRIDITVVRWRLDTIKEPTVRARLG